MKVYCPHERTQPMQNCFFLCNSKCYSLIIKTLDPRKGHGCNNISIKILQICGESIALPLKLIFEKALKTINF